MENYKRQENLEALKTLVAQYEEGLRRFGVEINSLPEDVSKMLDVCTEAQMLTGLHDMDELYLKEFYLHKKKEQVDNRLAASKVQAEIEELKKEIQQETKECDVLKSFLEQRVPSESECRINASLLENKIQNLQSKQDQIQLPENLDLYELLKKIEILKARETDGKK